MSNRDNVAKMRDNRLDYTSTGVSASVNPSASLGVGAIAGVLARHAPPGTPGTRDQTTPNPDFGRAIAIPAHRGGAGAGPVDLSVNVAEGDYVGGGGVGAGAGSGMGDFSTPVKTADLLSRATQQTLRAGGGQRGIFATPYANMNAAFAKADALITRINAESAAGLPLGIHAGGNAKLGGDGPIAGAGIVEGDDVVRPVGMKLSQRKAPIQRKPLKSFDSVLGLASPATKLRFDKLSPRQKAKLGQKLFLPKTPHARRQLKYAVGKAGVDDGF
jgi:hypothetical protein